MHKEEQVQIVDEKDLKDGTLPAETGKQLFPEMYDFEFEEEDNE